jgi:Uma2 family endonuclease
METLGMALDGPVEPHAWEEIEPPDVSGIVTEDDTPVDNLYSAKQQRLLVEPLYTSWTPDPAADGTARVFLADANVGLFPSVREPPLVPDGFLSLDVTPRANLWEKRNRTYFFWEFGKPPEVVVEVVSNREGGELVEKKRRYARMRIAHYVVWDPGRHLGPVDLHAFELRGDVYAPSDAALLASVNLGLVRWSGTYEGVTNIWLRWALPGGTVVETGAERAEQERGRAEQERARADRLAEKLRAAGLDPEGD